MIDANAAYTLEEATDAIRAFADYDIFWFEEPLHWYDWMRGLGRLAQRPHVDLASGESELHRWAIRDLVDQGGIRYMQFRSEEHTSELQSLMRISYAVSCLKKNTYTNQHSKQTAKEQTQLTQD